MSLSGGLVVYTWTTRASFINYAQPIRFSLLFIEGTGFDYFGFTRASLDWRGDENAGMESCEPVYLAAYSGIFRY